MRHGASLGEIGELLGHHNPETTNIKVDLDALRTLAMAWGCAMNTFRDAVRECLEIRRGLGFKLREAANGLIDFVTFLEQRKASSITQKLALEWAQQPPNAHPAY